MSCTIIGKLQSRLSDYGHGVRGIFLMSVCRRSQQQGSARDSRKGSCILRAGREKASTTNGHQGPTSGGYEESHARSFDRCSISTGFDTADACIVLELLRA